MFILRIYNGVSLGLALKPTLLRRENARMTLHSAILGGITRRVIPYTDDQKDVVGV